MNRALFTVTCASVSFACIEADRNRYLTAPTDTVSDSDADDTTNIEPDETDTDGDGPPPDCDELHLCEQPSAPCAEAVCEDGVCVVRRKERLAPCDDGNACTDDGHCDGDDCKDGPARENGTGCDDGLYCNGVGECQDGECVTSIVQTCPLSNLPCVTGYVCSEELLGGCAPEPAPDGGDCPLGTGQGECSAGECVPTGMAWVARGAFIMGCDPGPLCPFDARPAHDILLSGFAIDRTEVTEHMWTACVATGDCKARDNEAEANVTQRDPSTPVRDVGWTAAVQICQARGARLCTEAEWEKAARGTDGTFNFPWGNALATCERANYHELLAGPGCGTDGPSEIGEHASGASPYGILDMAGNVAEWVLDVYDADIYQSRVSGTPEDPVFNPDEGAVRVIRGGGWDTLVDGIRVFKRTGQTATFVDDEVGVRCCWGEGD